VTMSAATVPALPDLTEEAPRATRSTDDGESRDIDAATLVACRKGDPAALRVFITRYQQLVFAFLSRSLGRGPHVEDLAQEVFIRACRAIPEFDIEGPARVSTWLLTITSRLVVDTRRKRHLPTAMLESEESVVAAATPETERRRAELGRALEGAVCQLSNEQRDVFVLAELHGLAMADIAAILGIGENTAKTRLFRARSQLRTLLIEFWEDP
jgi:RNA polymerase sigma-70 factor, ECF subfamily